MGVSVPSIAREFHGAFGASFWWYSGTTVEGAV
jgi:hypothetical protein